jgi:hypothetical protein
MVFRYCLATVLKSRSSCNGLHMALNYENRESAVYIILKETLDGRRPLLQLG